MAEDLSKKAKKATDYSKDENMTHAFLGAEEFDRLARGLAATFHDTSLRGGSDYRTALAVGDVIRVGRRGAPGEVETVTAAVVIDIAKVQRGKGEKRLQFTYFYSLRLPRGALPECPWDVKAAQNGHEVRYK